MNPLRRSLSLRIKSLKSLARGLLLRAFGPRALGIFVETPWGLMLVDPRDGHVSRQFLRSGCYNHEEVSFIKTLLGPSDRVLIVGGHIGGVAIPLSKFVRSIDVVEASPKNYQLLAANTVLSEATNLTCHHWAASEKNGQIQFLMSSENSGGSKRLPATPKLNYNYDKPTLVTVPAHRLDDKFLDPFDIILMDIEGSEFFALRGGVALVSKCRVFIFEFIPDHIRNVAGISLEDFLNELPLLCFTVATLPRKKKRVRITELRHELRKLFESNDYEDGVVLTRE
jgi:FkbM family methyltransferase